MAAAEEGEGLRRASRTICQSVQTVVPRGGGVGGGERAAALNTNACVCGWLRVETYASVEARSCSSVQQLRAARYQARRRKHMRERKKKKRKDRQGQDESRE